MTCGGRWRQASIQLSPLVVLKGSVHEEQSDRDASISYGGSALVQGLCPGKNKERLR